MKVAGPLGRPALGAAAALVSLAALTSCSSSGSGAASPRQGTASSAPRAPSTTAPPPAAAAWPTYFRDAARSGYDPTEPPVSNPQSAWSTALPANTYAEPLVVGNQVIAATEGNDVVSVDAATGKVEWSTNLGPPMSGSQLPCGNIDPSGITGTPVVDTAAGVVWVVANVQPGHHDLVGLSLSTGAVVARAGADPPGSVPLDQQQRGALSLVGGRVYIPFGGLFGDCGHYHGYVVSMGGSPLAQQAVFNATPESNEGAIWAPSGATLGSSADLFVATGNGASTSSFDGGEAVVRIATPSLTALDRFYPSDFVELNATDSDLGSTGPTLVGSGLVFQVGKAGVAYLLQAGHLGGQGSEVASLKLCQGAYGANATLPATAPGTYPTVFVPCLDGLYAVRVGPGNTLHVLWSGLGAEPGPPIVSGGAVWVQVPSSGSLVSLNPTTGAQLSSIHVGSATRFATPASGGGRLFAAADNRLVAISGI